MPETTIATSLPPGRRAANAARKERAVTRAALDLSEERGFSAVTMAEIAERAGVTERTIFRTFGSKAGIFWHRSFFERLTDRVDETEAVGNPLRAVVEAATAIARELDADDREVEARRRMLILGEPELSGAGALSLGHVIGRLAERITPDSADAQCRHRLGLFALFAALAVASVPLRAEESVDQWIEEITRVLSLAAFGPLSRPQP